MNYSKNLYEHLQNNKEKKANLVILQEIIDIDLQLRYFKKSKEVKKTLDKNYDYLLDVKKLYTPEIIDNDKEMLICQLASFDKIAYYRALEKYKELAPSQLQSWITLAVQESKILIESSLLEEKQLFIFTGLGGKKSKLRYFVVLISNSGNLFTPKQQNIINNEFSFNLNKNDGELEEIIFDYKFAKITCLLPIQKPIQKILNSAQQECNSFGNFIQKNILITNVKIMTTQEIDNFLNSNDKKIKSNLSIDSNNPDDNNITY